MNVRHLTRNQARILLNIINKQPFLLKQNSLGGTLSALKRNGYILPLGRINRVFNWELIKNFEPEELEIIRKIAQ